MQGLATGAHHAVRDKRQSVGSHGWPPKVSRQQVQCVTGAGVTGEPGTETPLEDLGTQSQRQTNEKGAHYLYRVGCVEFS